MTTRKARVDGANVSPSVRARRRHRARPTPRWLAQATEVDQVAKARCLLVLDVLSGRVPVSDAIQGAQLARPTYYQLETRALQAMLTALTPGAETAGQADRLASSRRIATLEAQVKELSQGKRRAERLLALTRKVIVPRNVRLARGRGPRSTGRTKPTMTKPPATTRSTSTPAGGGAC
jgi:hypothetical protein